MYVKVQVTLVSSLPGNDDVRVVFAGRAKRPGQAKICDLQNPIRVNE